ncbi:3-oxo-tetronate kinase [uncultured Nitratireductor sp.]|uniref:3-oxo-tetronate kinase n=1 Tax=uncultured Nitratireductor sp. TaxID=520953 RepID=UPI0025D71FB4|nr:3-oxo-tetronate kinase [uncultured Nitratireductor sp.]
MLLGCIGDDFTGSSDLANTLAKSGMKTIQYCGVPVDPADPSVEVGVVALKSRTIPVTDAVRQSLQAVEWLLKQGARQIYFKYCSTFDSTPEGNIGPVIDALMEHLGVEQTLVCPAFPATGRTVYQGHLFVSDRLLNESGMEHHPLTPMRDADIRRWLAPQTRGAVGHVSAQAVREGPEAILAALTREAAEGRTRVVVDTIADEDLHWIGAAVRDMKLVTGGSGLALGLPANFRDAGLLGSDRETWEGSAGRAVVLSGSCSNQTRRQIAEYSQGHPILKVEPEAVLSGAMTPRAAMEWIDVQPTGIAPLVYSSSEPDEVRAAQSKFGRDEVAAALEGFFAATALELVANGYERLVIAGGETSGAIVEALDFSALEVGPEIAPGVPALKAEDRPVWVALKSGNFGDEAFFAKALDVMKGETT